ncbi:MAG: hypothetical protein ABL900_16930 [Burkholderiaceae bacterium]
MNAWFRSSATLFCGFAVAGAAAAPRNVEAFDAATWPALQAALEQPAVVVFSTTDCVHCPAVIEQLVRDIRKRKLKATSIAVVMDVAPGESDSTLLRNAEYRKTDRLFAFVGQAPPLRYAIDPRWRGVTPYVVFLAPNVPAVRVTGPPSREDFDNWARTAALSRPGAVRASGPSR